MWREGSVATPQRSVASTWDVIMEARSTPSPPKQCGVISTAVIRSITIMDLMRILAGTMRRPEAWSPQSRTGPEQSSYPALVIILNLDWSVVSSVKRVGPGVAVTWSMRPAMLVAPSSSQITMSCVKITCSGET